MTSNPTGGLVAPSDIADMAGVSRAAVSNWRKRADDFPTPASGSAAKPLFDRAAVTTWLEMRGYAIRRDPDREAWAALNALRGRYPLEVLADALLWFACLKKATSSPSLSSRSWEELRARAGGDSAGALYAIAHNMAVAPAWAELFDDEPAWQRSVDANVAGQLIDIVANLAEDDLASVTDYALERVAIGQGRSGGEVGAVGSRVSELLATLAGQHPGGTLYDPACGVGAALLAAAEQDRQRIVGHDIDNAAMSVTRRRAFLRDLTVELTVADVLRFDPDPRLRSDVIIAEPPMGVAWEPSSAFDDPRFGWGVAPPRSADLAWVQHVVAHLAPKAYGYVISNRGSLFRGGPERQIRAELIRQGCVQAIVGLPGKMLPYTSMPLALWVLRPAGTVTDRVLFVDVEDVDSIDAEVTAALQRTSTASEGSTLVDFVDLLAADSVLSPERWTNAGEPAAAEVAHEFHTAFDNMERALGRLANSSKFLKLVTNVSTARIVTLGDLATQGAIEIRAGKPTDRYVDVPDRYRNRIVQASDIRDKTMPGDPPDEGPDDPPDLTRDGDVLVTTMHTIRATVDQTGANLPATGVYRIRVISDAISSAYLAAVIPGSWNNRFQSGSTITRADIKALEVPIVTKQAQKDISLFAFAIELIHAIGREVAGYADIVKNSFLDAVRYEVPLNETGVADDPSGECT